jgi:hypothetical protein
VTCDAGVIRGDDATHEEKPVTEDADGDNRQNGDSRLNP